MGNAESGDNLSHNEPLATSRFRSDLILGYYISHSLTEGKFMARRETLIDELGRIVGMTNVRAEARALAEHMWDALSEARLHPQKRPEVVPPLCVVLPSSTLEVQKIVCLANEEKVSIVPFGGGSGLMGGALSIRPGIVIDLKRMDQILEVDRESRSVRVQAGAILESVEKRLNEAGLILGHDPWTVPVATVGGAISTNSVGYRGAKYGSMGDQVLGLEAVLPNGEIISTRRVEKSSTGMDLKRLFIGGEGCFGIVTEATLRVFPIPEERCVFGFGFASFDRGYGAIQKIFARGLKPAVIDFGDQGEMNPHAVLYLAFEGVREIVQAEKRLAVAICESEEGLRLPQEQAQRFWEDRHVIAHNFVRNRAARRDRRGGLARDWIHVALPASQVLPFKQAASEVISRRGVSLQECGLWNQPELFSMRIALQDEEQPERLEDAIEELLRLVQEMGGSMEYCHGVGVKLGPLMQTEHGYGLDVMRKIKNSLDPNGIMNPGKMGL
jgi:FAD/FMN-containing dehydrogenase